MKYAKKPSRRRKRRRLLFILLLVAVLGLSVGWLHSRQPVRGVIAGDIAPFTKMIAFSNDMTKALNGKLIILDPGHGGGDPGCVYPDVHPTMLESSINLTFAEATKRALEAQGATVILLRTDDSWSSLYQRIALTHLSAIQYATQMGITSLSEIEKNRLIGELSDTVESNSDKTAGKGIMAGPGVGSELGLLMNLEKACTNVLFISIHTNSNDVSSPHGTQVYYVTNASVKDSHSSSSDYQKDGARNQLFAETLYGSIVASVPQMATSAGATVAGNYAVLRDHNLTSALIEVGFISNQQDRSYLTNSTSIAKISAGIAKGCVNFFAGLK